MGVVKAILRSLVGCGALGATRRGNAARRDNGRADIGLSPGRRRARLARGVYGAGGEEARGDKLLVVGENLFSRRELGFLEKLMVVILADARGGSSTKGGIIGAVAAESESVTDAPPDLSEAKSGPGPQQSTIRGAFKRRRYWWLRGIWGGKLAVVAADPLAAPGPEIGLLQEGGKMGVIVQSRGKVSSGEGPEKGDGRDGRGAVAHGSLAEAAWSACRDGGRTTTRGPLGDGKRRRRHEASGPRGRRRLEEGRGVER